MLNREIAYISDNGERVTHLHPNSSYQAHLSIYMFAAGYARGADVLDAGSGAGYGSYYLAEKAGANRVEAIDVSPKAIEFSCKHFNRANLHYQVMDLEQIEGFAPQSFDLIFSSNTLEHVAHVEKFLAAAWMLLRPEGALILAVPPVYNAESRAANLANPYHLNIWSPRQWHYALSRYFAEVTCIRHHVEVSGRSTNFADAPESPQFHAEEFVFLPSSVDELCTIGALTAMFIARRPRRTTEMEVPTAAIPMIDDSFTRPPLALEASRPQPAWRNALANRWLALRRRLGV